MGGVKIKKDDQKPATRKLEAGFFICPGYALPLLRVSTHSAPGVLIFKE
jgi:hypothetical protein